MTIGTLGMKSKTGVQKLGCRKAALSWRVKNALRPYFIIGWLQYHIALLVAALFHIPTITSRLSIRVRLSSGDWIDYGTVSYRKITKVGATFLVDAWVTGSAPIANMKYHGCGTTGTAESNVDTGLVSECGVALNPDNTRATGTQSKTGSDNNVMHSEGTLTFDNTAAVCEHGLFSQALVGTTILWDRSVFNAVNVSGGDSILFKYECQINYEA